MAADQQPGGLVEIVVRGRNVEVPDHFRQHVTEKVGRIEKFDQRVIRVDVELLHERNPRQSEICQRIEITCRVPGPVIRAEACAADFYKALELAIDRLERRFRQAADRRRIHHGRHTPTSVAVATGQLADAVMPAVPGAVAVVDRFDDKDSGTASESAANPDVGGSLPGAARALIVREKEHPAKPMTIEQALYEMEMVGHDFYLFSDSDTGFPSVVYQRKGYDYGVIRLTD